MVCHVALLGMGWLASVATPAESVPASGVAVLAAPLALVDALALEQVTRRFEPALAPGLLASLGPRPAFYTALVVLVVSAALLGRWRSAPRTLLSVGLAALLALELWLLGAVLFDRPAPLELDPALPIPDEWRALWQAGGAFPSRHTLLAAALAGSALIAWPPIGLAAMALALCGSLTAVYFGAAHATDVAAGLLLGTGASVAGRLGAVLVWSGRLR